MTSLEAQFDDVMDSFKKGDDRPLHLWYRVCQDCRRENQLLHFFRGNPSNDLICEPCGIHRAASLRGAFVESPDPAGYPLGGSRFSWETHPLDAVAQVMERERRELP